MESDSPSRAERRKAGRSPWDIVGLLFCAVWAAAVLFFPLRKGMWLGYVPVAVGMAAGAALCLGRVRNLAARRLDRPPTWQFLLWWAGIGLALRAATILLYSPDLVSDSAVYHALGVRLADGRGYGASAFLPPGYPFLLSAWYALTAARPVWAMVLGALVGTA